MRRYTSCPLPAVRRGAAVVAVLALAAGPVGCGSSSDPGDLDSPFEVVVVGTLDGPIELYAVPSDGAGRTRLTDDDVQERWYAVSSEDGRIVVLRTGTAAGTDLWVMGRDGSGLRNLTNTPERWDGQAAWSRDGSRVAYVEPVPGGGEDIWVANADGSSPVNLTPADDGAMDGAPTWSPDGSRIAFVSTRAGEPDIWVMDADGTNAATVTAGTGSQESWPAWSPDGSRIAFSRGPGARDIFLLDPDGTDLMNLSANPVRDDERPVWSPDGSRILFAATWPDAEPEILVANAADGQDRVNVSDHPARDFHASWSPDGSLIAFTSFRDGLRQVYVVAPDGTGLRRLMEPAAGGAPRENWLESWAAWREP